LLRLQEAGEERVERHATWTELFFDLVFVVAVAQLATGLHSDASLDGAIAFVGLFAPVWWTWTNYAYLADLFDADGGLFRMVLLGAMLLVGGLAATIPDAFAGKTAGFVIAYALLRGDGGCTSRASTPASSTGPCAAGCASAASRSCSDTASCRCSPRLPPLAWGCGWPSKRHSEVVRRRTRRRSSAGPPARRSSRSCSGRRRRACPGSPSPAAAPLPRSRSPSR